MYISLAVTLYICLLYLQRVIRVAINSFRSKWKAFGSRRDQFKGDRETPFSEVRLWSFNFQFSSKMPIIAIDLIRHGLCVRHDQRENMRPYVHINETMWLTDWLTEQTDYLPASVDTIHVPKMVSVCSPDRQKYTRFFLPIICWSVARRIRDCVHPMKMWSDLRLQCVPLIIGTLKKLI